MSSQTRREARAGRIGHQLSSSSASWPSVLGFKPQVTWRNVTAFLVHCSASILFLVFLNASQPFLIHQLESIHAESGSGQPSRAGSLSGSLIFYDELLSTFVSLVWGALAESVGLAAVTSSSYIFIAIGLVSYTLPKKPWPDLIPARLVFAIGGSGATAMLSGILSEYSGSQGARSDYLDERGPLHSTAEQDGETASQATLRPHPRQDRATRTEAGPLISADAVEGPDYSHTVGRAVPSRRHGRVAAIAGVFTGIGALIAVFALVQLPRRIADYLELHDLHKALSSSYKLKKGSETDVVLRKATVATFWLVAALALLVSAITAVGLKDETTRPHLRAADMLVQRTHGRQGQYGALHDSTIALAEDTRQARRARLRQRMERRAQTSWMYLLRSRVIEFISASVGGFHMVGLIGTRATRHADAETLKVQHRLALELRMAYLGGALARAFTIGTTAFLPLLVTHHYYTSGVCRQLPSPNPNEPLPNDELKKLCRSAFTSTAILGGTAQLTALLASPLIGLLCDTLSPITSISLTSALGAVGFYLLGVGTSGFAGDAQTGEEVPDPLTRLSIVAAVLVGIGQIGAIVASLAGCARARGFLTDMEGEGTNASSSEDHAGGEADMDTTPSSETLMPEPQHRRAEARVSRIHGADDMQLLYKVGRGPGAIAGAYTCTGSLSILVVSKLGGFLFDMYVPSPFLLIGGFAALVSICGFAIGITKRFKRL